MSKAQTAPGGAFAAGQMVGLVFGVLLLLVGGYYLIKG